MGTPVSGIPTVFVLDASYPSITFSAQDYPGLATSAGMEMGWSANLDGLSSERGLELAVPESSSTLFLLGLGALSLLAYDWRWLRACFKKHFSPSLG